MSRDSRDQITISVRRFRGVDFIDSILKLLFRERKDSLTEKIGKKRHILYLSKYLEEQGAKVVLAEKHYFERDRLIDHWAYLPDSPELGQLDGIRLHIFTSMPPEIKLENKKSKNAEWVDKKWDECQALISNQEEEDNYLGFIVLLHGKSEKVIWKVCLRPPNTTRNKVIPALRNYPVNLVGHPLTVRTVGFKEQDQVTSVCATCAMWSLLQVTSDIYHHEILSPGEITTRGLDLRQRGTSLPVSKGLSALDMDHVVQSIPGVRAFHTSFSDDVRTRSDDVRTRSEVFHRRAYLFEKILEEEDNQEQKQLIKRTLGSPDAKVGGRRRKAFDQKDYMSSNPGKNEHNEKAKRILDLLDQFEKKENKLNEDEKRKLQEYCLCENRRENLQMIIAYILPFLDFGMPVILVMKSIKNGDIHAITVLGYEKSSTRGKRSIFQGISKNCFLGITGCEKFDRAR